MHSQFLISLIKPGITVIVFRILLSLIFFLAIAIFIKEKDLPAWANSFILSLLIYVRILFVHLVFFLPQTSFSFVFEQFQDLRYLRLQDFQCLVGPHLQALLLMKGQSKFLTLSLVSLIAVLLN